MKEGFKVKKDQKVKVLTESLKGEKGLIVSAIVNELKAEKIGQYSLLKANLKDDAGTKNLIEVLDMAVQGKSKDDALKTLQDTVKQTGFRSANSLVNYTYQLKEDSRLNLLTILQETKGSALLKKAVNSLLSDEVYEYTS